MLPVTEKINVIIAEDDTPVRQLLESILASFERVKQVTAVTNGRELTETANKLKPAVVFLDIEMPDTDGLTAALKLKEKFPGIFIVFVTAHTKYAAEAFRLEAVDYLVKPVTREAIGRAMTKIEKCLALNNNSGSSAADRRIAVKNSHEIYFINLRDIFFIEKEIRKSVIHTKNGKYLTTESLTSLEKKLNSDFFRCHKSFIINTQHIERISPVAERIYQICFYDYPLHVTMGRQKLEELYDLISGS